MCLLGLPQINNMSFGSTSKQPLELLELVNCLGSKYTAESTLNSTKILCWQCYTCNGVVTITTFKMVMRYYLCPLACKFWWEHWSIPHAQWQYKHTKYLVSVLALFSFICSTTCWWYRMLGLMSYNTIICRRWQICGLNKLYHNTSYETPSTKSFRWAQASSKLAGLHFVHVCMLLCWFGPTTSISNECIQTFHKDWMSVYSWEWK